MDRILKFSLFFIIFINFVYAKEDTKIIGGYKIEISQAPFQVSIIRTTSLGRSHKCGGSIITSRHILTAAHCTFNGPPLFGNLIPPSQFSVRVGSNDYQSGGEIIALSGYINHPEFEKIASFDYDFSIAILVRRIMFDYIRKAPISLGDAVLDGTTVFITGFGTTTLGGRSDRYLYRTAVKIVNQQQCANNYLNVFSLITNRMICAAAPGRDSCQGDSGGPMTTITSKNRPDKLIGIVSFGEECADPNYPGVYSRISSVRPWITYYTGI